jgi:hypothetical protein
MTVAGLLQAIELPGEDREMGEDAEFATREVAVGNGEPLGGAGAASNVLGREPGYCCVRDRQYILRSGSSPAAVPKIGWGMT